MEEQRSQAKARSLTLRPAPFCAYLVPKGSLSILGVVMGWVTASRKRIFTTETPKVFHLPNADERAKGIISQSVA